MWVTWVTRSDLSRNKLSKETRLESEWKFVKILTYQVFVIFLLLQSFTFSRSVFFAQISTTRIWISTTESCKDFKVTTPTMAGEILHSLSPKSIKRGILQNLQRLSIVSSFHLFISSSPPKVPDNAWVFYILVNLGQIFQNYNSDCQSNQKWYQGCRYCGPKLYYYHQFLCPTNHKHF